MNRRMDEWECPEEGGGDVVVWDGERGSSWGESGREREGEGEGEREREEREEEG
jgi:hypothetical protein